jgi:HlyD family secretion protein
VTRWLALGVLAAALAGCGMPADPYWQGYMEGEYVLLASPAAGQLQQLHVRRGDRVETGKALFALENESERAARLQAEEQLKSAAARLANLRAGRRPAEIAALRAEVTQAQSALALSSSQLAQQRKLFDGGFIAQARLDEATTARARDAARLAEAQAQLRTALQPLGREAERAAAEGEVAAARAALAQAAWRLEQKSVAAPAAGVVQDTFYVEGEWVPAGRPVVSLLPPGNVKARFYVPQAALGTLAPGQAVEIRCDGCPAPVAARVSFISSQAEYTPPVLYSRESRAKLLFLVEARPQPADAARLRPGQPVEVHRK